MADSTNPTYNQALTTPTVSAAQAPVTPSPNLSTPATPSISPVGQKYGTGSGDLVGAETFVLNPVQNQVLTTPTTSNAQTAASGGAQTVNNPLQPTPTNGTAVTGNGSVVDLLNSAGQDSSYAARQQLAQQYGIQNYTGTAAQNQELAKKYTDTYNKLKGTAVPQNGADARTAIDESQQGDNGLAQQNPEQSFYDAYASMNPVVKSLYDNLNTALSSLGTQQTFTQQYQDLVAQQGIPGLQTDLLNINRIMSGTEDDIRDEVASAGGFVTESQVQALAGARNKTLLKQATALQDQLQVKQDYVKQIMDLTQADRAEVDKGIDLKLNVADKVSTLQTNMENAARENYQNILTNYGFSGLSQLTGGNPTAEANIERVMGLPAGFLQNEAVLDMKKVQEQKALQYVSGTENQSAGVFDPNTGAFTSYGEGGQGGGSGSPVSGSNPYSSVIPTILGSGTFTKQQASAITNAIKNGDDPFTVIKNQAKNIMGQTEATKLTSYEAADNAMQDVEKSFNNYYQAGGDTGIISGNWEDVLQKAGQVKDPAKRALATEVAISLQAYRNAISGTAYSNQEGQQIQNVFPGINKSEGLNKAIIAGRLKADGSIIDGIYKTALGENTYDNLKAISQSETAPKQSPTSKFDSVADSIDVDTKTGSATLPRSVWKGVEDKDGLLDYVKSLGYNLLIND